MSIRTCCPCILRALLCLLTGGEWNTTPAEALGSILSEVELHLLHHSCTECTKDASFRGEQSVKQISPTPAIP